MSEHKTSDRRLAVLRPFAGRSYRSRRNHSNPDKPDDDTSTPSSPTTPEASVVDSAIYRDGDRIASPKTLAETYQLLDQDPDTLAWIGLYRPNEQQLASLADEFDRTSSRSRTRSWPTSGRSWSATTRLSSSC